MQGGLERFHPAVAGWFSTELGTPTGAQQGGWPPILRGSDTLIAAPTGSGKTLAAFLAAIDSLVRRSIAGELTDAVEVVYVSPLKALSHDIERNLQRPLAGIAARLADAKTEAAAVRAAVRTGDTTQAQRTALVRTPPHILVTTPESLYILLTSDSGRRLLSTARTAIIDEIHAVVDGRRGAHLSLSLERLDALCERRLQRIGLSATQKPIELIARFLTGTAGGTPLDCAIVDEGHARELDLAIELPSAPLAAVMSADEMEETYDRLAELIEAHRTTLVFVNTRRLAERATRQLRQRLGEAVAAHHGSLARDQRLAVERRLKDGQLRGLVATASLELGIDIGSIDLVCQLGSTRSIARLLQRVGRAGHRLGVVPKGRLFPLSRDELLEAVALLAAIERGELERSRVPEAPLDVLAQQIVATCAGEELSEDELFARLTRAYPYLSLQRERFDQVVRMLAEGFVTKRGRRRAYLHHDRIHRRVRGRRGARLTAITSGGAIPDNADYEVRLQPADARIGTINEDFAIESMPGDIFQLGSQSWRILRIIPGKVLVEDAAGQPPTIPFWLGEAPGRSDELSAAVSRVRERFDAELAATTSPDVGVARAVDRLDGELPVASAGIQQIAEYLAATRGVLGVVPTRRQVVLERFFDEAGGMQLVLHAPFGSRINRAWGLALRKRFCRRFNFELQAAATEDALVLSLGPQHSFPLAEVLGYLRPHTVREVLVQALLDTPIFEVRWRWNACRALAVPRWRGGRKVAPQLQRYEADDLLSLVFPDQVACQENLAGDREIPDHPLVAQTIEDCLTEGTDLAGLQRVLAAIEAGAIEIRAVDAPTPSPMAQEILNARPYAFLDDAPLEERRTQAVYARRWLDPQLATELGHLDAEAIARVREQAWPRAEDPDELHEALMLLGFATGREARDSRWDPHFAELVERGRATRLSLPGAADELWCAAERLPELRAALPGAIPEPPVELPVALDAQWDPHEALTEVIRSRLEGLGPQTAAQLARPAGLALERVERALASLEAEGYILRGHFAPDATSADLDGDESDRAPTGQPAGATQWCERALLARIHRYTIDRLRKAVEPVSPSTFMRFLFSWQHISQDSRVEGESGLSAVLRQLDGFEAPAVAWESEILPARVQSYDPRWLDQRCTSGEVCWGRLRAFRETGRNGNGKRRRNGQARPVRATPVTLVQRTALDSWQRAAPLPAIAALGLSSEAGRVYELLDRRGACFFSDLERDARLLRSQLEQALAELVAVGLVTADSFAGLRALLVPASKRRSHPRRRRAELPYAVESAGRWSPLRRSSDPPAADDPAGAGETSRGNGTPRQPARYAFDQLEPVARALLRRYGVVFYRLLAREGQLPPWRELLRVYRTLEARGEIRGGRFIAGFSGEQYALPEAVGALRKARRASAPGDAPPPAAATGRAAVADAAAPDDSNESADRGELVAISAADPLNLVGIVTPGARVPAVARNRLLFRDGEPVALREGKEIRYLRELAPQVREACRRALLTPRVARPLRKLSLV